MLDKYFKQNPGVGKICIILGRGSHSCSACTDDEASPVWLGVNRWLQDHEGVVLRKTELGCVELGVSRLLFKPKKSSKENVSKTNDVARVSDLNPNAVAFIPCAQRSGHLVWGQGSPG